MVQTRYNCIIHTFLSLALFSSTAYSTISFFGNDMDECMRFADEFKNTCDTSESKPINVASIPGEEVTCANSGDYCINSGNFNSATGECTWTRKLCVTCEPYGTSRVLINV